MDDRLFKAVLSMDAYNRGYDPGIRFGSNPNASQDTVGTEIGRAEILTSFGDVEAQDIGFLRHCI